MNNVNDSQWRIRPTGSNPSLQTLYGNNYNTNFTTLEFYHGGNFTPTPNRDYIKGKFTIVDFFKVTHLSFDLLSDIMRAIGLKGEPKFYGFEHKFGLDLGLFRLETQDDFLDFYLKIFPAKCNQIHRIYVEVNGTTQIAFFPDSLKKASPKVIEKMVSDFVEDHPFATVKQARDYVYEVFGVWISEFQLKEGFNRTRQDMLVRRGLLEF